MDTITASLATIPSRVVPLEEMFYSIIEQVDCLQVYLNGFEDKQIPQFLLKNNKVKLYRSQEEEFGDRGDAGKFFNVQNIHGWHFVTDDDIHFPKDYVVSMINKCEQYDRKYIIGCHGGDWSKFPVNDAYKDRKNMSHYKKTEVLEDYFVHFLATNTMCFHDNTIQMEDVYFELPNMGDIFAAKLAQEKHVGMICREKKEGWIQDASGYQFMDSIYGYRYKPLLEHSDKTNASYQTDIVNILGGAWKYYV